MGSDSILGSNFKIRISLLGSFQNPEFRHEAEKFDPCLHHTHTGHDGDEELRTVGVGPGVGHG